MTRTEQLEALNAMQENPENNEGLVGLEWDSPRGRRRVIGVQQIGGHLRAGIQTDGSSNVELLPPSEVLDEKRRDETNLAYQSQVAQRREAEALVAREALYFHGFTEGMTPRSAQRAQDALDKRQLFNSVPYRRGDFIEERVAQGWRVVVTARGERRFVGPDDSFFLQPDITKTGMDYAEYLVEHGVQENPRRRRHHDSDYYFFGTCVASTAENIQALRDSSQRVTWKTFRKHIPEARDFFEEQGAIHKDATDVDIENSPFIVFNKGFHRGRPAYYADWSGYEWIWERANQERNPGSRCQGCGSVLLEDEVPESATSGVCLLCAIDSLREDIREAERDGGYDSAWIVAAKVELGRLYGLRRARS